MRIPTFHKQDKRQWLISGIVIGSCISWLLFLYMFGAQQEKQATMIARQKNEIQDLQSNLLIWQEEFKELNKKNLHQLTVQEINIDIVNFEKYGIDDAQSIFEAKETIKKDLSVLYAKDLETVYSHKELIRQTIENKTLKLNNKSYSLHVKEWIFHTTMYMKLELHLNKT